MDWKEQLNKLMQKRKSALKNNSKQNQMPGAL
jgi:hypothetical protein